MFTLYIKQRCPWCIDAVNYLQEQKIEFRIIDVRENNNAYKHMQDISGQSLTPTLEANGIGVLADFDVPQLENFLKKHNIIK